MWIRPESDVSSLGDSPSSLGSTESWKKEDKKLENTNLKSTYSLGKCVFSYCDKYCPEHQSKKWILKKVMDCQSKTANLPKYIKNIERLHKVNEKLLTVQKSFILIIFLFFFLLLIFKYTFCLAPCHERWLTTLFVCLLTK